MEEEADEKPTMKMGRTIYYHQRPHQQYHTKFAVQYQLVCVSVRVERDEAQHEERTTETEKKKRRKLTELQKLVEHSLHMR